MGPLGGARAHSPARGPAARPPPSRAPRRPRVTRRVLSRPPSRAEWSTGPAATGNTRLRGEPRLAPRRGGPAWPPSPSAPARRREGSRALSPLTEQPGTGGLRQMASAAHSTEVPPPPRAGSWIVIGPQVVVRDAQPAGYCGFLSREPGGARLTPRRPSSARGREPEAVRALPRGHRQRGAAARPHISAAERTVDSEAEASCLLVMGVNALSPRVCCFDYFLCPLVVPGSNTHPPHTHTRTVRWVDSMLTGK